MQTTEVNPPRAAAAVPVAMVLLAVWPGSRRCTCKSIRPGQTTSPSASDALDVRGGLRDGPCADGGNFSVLESSTSAMASRRLAGSMTRPPVRSSEFIGKRGYGGELTTQAHCEYMRVKLNHRSHTRIDFAKHFLILTE